MMDLFWMIFELVVNLFQSAIVLQTIRAILKDKRTGKKANLAYILFVAILCMILVLRRNIFGGILYLASYGFYFGGYIITNMLPSIMSGEAMNVSIMQNAFVSAVGLIIAFCVFFDLLVNSIRKRDPKDKKTDWFFNNEQYDRKYDDRADKNNYRTL